MYFPIILGTARRGRQSEKVARFVLRKTLASGIKSEIIDVRDYRIKATDNTEQIPQAKKLAQKINKADALIIISPEYNASYPGELKMMLDMLYSQYYGKPVGICGVSAVNFGGAKMISKLNSLCLALRMIPLSTPLYFPKVQEIFNKKGEPKDNSYHKRVEKFLEELINYANCLKTLKKKGGET